MARNDQSPITAISIRDNYSQLGDPDITGRHISLLLSRVALNTKFINFNHLLLFLHNHPTIQVLELGELFNEGMISRTVPPDTLPKLTRLSLPARLIPQFLSYLPKLEQLTILENMDRDPPRPDLRSLAAKTQLYLQVEFEQFHQFAPPALSPFYQQHTEALTIVVDYANAQPNDALFAWLAKFVRLSRVSVVYGRCEWPWSACLGNVADKLVAACPSLGENVRFVKKDSIEWMHRLAFADYWKS